MIEHLAQALLVHIYYPVTAAVSIDRDGKIIGLLLFDSRFGTDERTISSGADSAAILCGHPDGRMALTEEEIANCRRIARENPDIQVNVYICGEDIGCIEVDSTAFCGYNEENAI